MKFILVLITIVNCNIDVLVFVLPNNQLTRDDGLLTYGMRQGITSTSREIDLSESIDSQDHLRLFLNYKHYFVFTATDEPAIIYMGFKQKNFEQEINLKPTGSQKSTNMIIEWEDFTFGILDCNLYQIYNEDRSLDMCPILRYFNHPPTRFIGRLLIIPKGTKSMENTFLVQDNLLEYFKFKNSYTENPVILSDVFRMGEIELNYNSNSHVFMITNDLLGKSGLMFQSVNLEVHFLPLIFRVGKRLIRTIKYIYFGNSDHCCREFARLEMAITVEGNPPILLFEKKFETVVTGPVGHLFLFDINIPSSFSETMQISGYISVFKSENDVFTVERHCLTFNYVVSIENLYKAGSVNNHNIVFQTHKEEKSETIDVTMVVHSTLANFKFSGCHLKVKRRSSCQRKPLQLLSANKASFKTQKSPRGSYILQLDDRVLNIEFSDKRQILDTLNQVGQVELYEISFINGHKNDDEIVQMPIPEIIKNVIEARKREKLEDEMTVVA